MVSNYRNTNNLNTQLMGLSTDTKPTVGVEPNALFWELDTNGMYFFDGTQWQSIGGSGGGGGSSAGSVITVTLTGDVGYGFAGLAPDSVNVSGLLEIDDHYHYDYTFEDDPAGQQYNVLLLGENVRFRVSKTFPEPVVTGAATVTSDEYDYTVTVTGDCAITVTANT